MLAVSIGAGAGFASIVFRRMIQLAHWLFFTGLGEYLTPWLGSLYTIPLVALGGLLVGIMTRYMDPQTKGHGVPEVMLAVAYRGGRIRPQLTLFKSIGAALTIGSGGSAGREGPIVQIGSAIGSTVGQFLRLPDRRMILSVACGTAGGIAATFNAPMAGVIFSLEVILGRFTATSFGLVVMSSATATVVSQALSAEGDSPAFGMLHTYSIAGIWDLFFFLVLGVLCALVAQVYTRTLYAIEDLTDKIRAPEIIKPAAGGALVGALAIWTPQVMGTSYETIESALNDQMLMRTLFLLCAAKILATALTIGTGGSGGIFAPALYTGAMFGGAFGSLVHSTFPDITSRPGAFAMVGMASVFGGAARAPITAIFILFEMTDNYRIIVPLMSATVICTFVSQYFSAESIYTLKLKRRGINLGRAQDINLMDAITVGEAMEQHVEAAPPNLPVSALIEKMTSQHNTGYPVIDVDGNLVGIVTIRDVQEALLGRPPAKLSVGDICTKNVMVCRPEQTLSAALAQFGAHDYGRLPVIDPENPKRVIGILKRANIVTAYAEAYQRSQEMAPKGDAVQTLTERGQMAVEHAYVTAGSRLANVLVRDAQFPPEAVLGAIRRAHQTVVPRGSTRILPGDSIVVLTSRDQADTVRKWIRENS